MDEQERNAVLKVGLWLAIVEGWVTLVSTADRLAMDPLLPAIWLHRNGYIESGDAGKVIRWNGEHGFEHLWGSLVPGRPCPVRLRTAVEHTEILH